MTTLKEARETGKLAQFVKEHRRDPKGDATAFNHTLKAMAGKSKPVPKTSSADDPAD
jgi:hypothetical protein